LVYFGSKKGDETMPKGKRSKDVESAQVIMSKICRLLTTEEAAEILQLDPNTIRSYLKKGELVGIKLGLTWRIELEDLRKFLDNQKQRRRRMKVTKPRKTCPYCLQTFGYGPFCSYAGEVTSNHSCEHFTPVRWYHYIQLWFYNTRKQWRLRRRKASK